ncbi:MAG: hypothetical protein ACI8UO_004306 [Verrucomicrobiales bacterium]|jgi:hypothetical protein
MNDPDNPGIDLRLALIGLSIFLLIGVASLVLILGFSNPSSVSDPSQSQTQAKPSATPEENARLLERASAELNGQGIAHVLPTSFAGIDRSLGLIRDLSASAKSSETLESAAALTDVEIRKAIDFLEVRGWGNELVISMQKPWASNLMPVSALSAEETVVEP